MPLLIIDDSRSSLLAIETAVRQFVTDEVETYTSPVRALARAEAVTFDIVFVDYMMPVLNGVDVIKTLRERPEYENVPIVMVTSERERSIRLQALEAGATDFLNKPFDPLELRARLSNLLALRQAQLALADKADNLDKALRTASKRADMREQEIIWCLAQAMAWRDGNTGDHIERVAGVAELIAEGIGLDRIRRRNIYLATPLHDIGKIGIPDALLLKPGKLEPHEIEKMREHVPIGVNILRNSSAELARVAVAIIGGHHRSPSKPASSPWPMSSMRSARSVPIRRPGRSRRPTARSSPAAAPISTPPASPLSARNGLRSASFARPRGRMRRKRRARRVNRFS